MLRRSVRTLAALAAGCWLLSTEYLDACAKAKKLLPPVRGPSVMPSDWRADQATGKISRGADQKYR